MAKYWVLIGQTVHGGNTGYTEAEILDLITQQQVLADTLVSVNSGIWMPANQVAALQQALAVNEICPQCLGKPYYARCDYSGCWDGYVGCYYAYEKRPYVGWLCPECHGSGRITICPVCGGSGKKR